MNYVAVLVNPGKNSITVRLLGITNVLSGLDRHHRGLRPQLCSQGAYRPQEYGTPESYLTSLQPLLGVQSWVGETESEGAPPRPPGTAAVHSGLVLLRRNAQSCRPADAGVDKTFFDICSRSHWGSRELFPGAPGGFKAGKVSVANVLSVGQSTKGGKTYYEYEILTRTADGDEGGRHHLISVAASNGKLYTFIGQAGDKRWFKVCC